MTSIGAGKSNSLSISECWKMAKKKMSKIHNLKNSQWKDVKFAEYFQNYCLKIPVITKKTIEKC